MISHKFENPHKKFKIIVPDLLKEQNLSVKICLTQQNMSLVKIFTVKQKLKTFVVPLADFEGQFVFQ